MSVFEIYKTANIDLKEFLTLNYQIEWKRDKAICPFHNDTKESLSYNKKNNTFKCMVCGTGGDVINFVEYYEKTNNIDACKKVLTLSNIHFQDFSSTTISEEDRERIHKEQEAKRIENEKQKQLKKEKEQKNKQAVIEKLTTEAPVHANFLYDNYSNIAGEINKLFPNQSSTFLDYRDIYLGYDSFHESICILNRTHNPNKCYNIKHRQKWLWDEKLKSYDTNTRNDGKWISTFNSSLFAFPYEYFKQHEDNRVIICEGEKDALNLLSYDINCLTLGGVTNSWEEHKHILKDKIVYIWFDNDSAGYIEALKKYREIEDVASSIYIVLFFHINNSLPNKYDISDFLADKKFKNKDDIFHSIAYSSFVLNNNLVDEIAEHLELNIKEVDKNKKENEKTIYQNSPLKEFKDIRNIFVKTDTHGTPINIFEAKGELDNKEVDKMIENFKGLSKDKDYKSFKDMALNSMLVGAEDKEKRFEELENIFAQFADLKQTLLTNYRQTHIVDMVNAFIKMANHTGYTFGEYKGMLTIWTGTHYEIVNDAQIIKFVMNDWFYHARIDIKKQTEKNAIELISNVRAKAVNIDEIKERNNEKRIINLLNGTLIISKRGKVIFKDRHDKKDGSTNILKFNYDEKADCPKWKKFVNRVLPNKQEQEALMQYIGYCLMPTHAYETFLLLYGKSGANGKSVIMDTISNFFGNENISSLDLQQFYGHEMEAISNKFINIGTEIDPRGMDKGQLPMLKKLVSPKDKVPINPKNRTPYQLESFEKPKLIFSANQKPKQGMDDAVFRRMLLLTFDSEIKDDEKIRDLSDRFKDELAGILNLALENLQVLISNGKFTKSERMVEEIEEYKDDINPIRKYVSENIEQDKEIMIPKKYLYAHYKEWTEAKGHKSLNEQNFWKKLKEELPEIDTAGKQKTLNGFDGLEGLPRCVEGIYCNSSEVAGFTLDKFEIRTNTINLDIKDKKSVIKEQKQK
ncbi:phage/plasmid primase, P4 family [Aliarcobacter butzleri]|uniref:phage/plasmid primase, P4 family n=1 Tax=Aliarcobacter butzleri TaxID=28197 RepID=UPI00125F2C8C|nr:phage/plasmid primase, P4 family [Aliarcobacter butzleri]